MVQVLVFLGTLVAGVIGFLNGVAKKKQNP